MSDKETGKKNKNSSTRKTVLVSLGILLVAVVVTVVVFMTEPEAKREGASKQTAMLVEVTHAEQGNYRPQIVATGVVKPARDVSLSPRISGEVVHVSGHFDPGAFVTKGEVLLQIDEADYENELYMRESELQQALANLEMEKGRQEVAKTDYQLVGDSLNGTNKALVLREPQLKSVKATVKAAETAVEQARLNLQRTTIKAPFDAHILSRNVNVGSQVSPGQNLGRMVGVHTYWVEASLPLAKIKWLRMPENETEQGARVKITSSAAWGDDEFRTGYVYRLIGALENQTRLARVLVAVPDPLALEDEHQNQPRMVIGTFVQAVVNGIELENIIRLRRDYLRQNETVWLMKNGALSIQAVSIVLKDAEYVYIDEGITATDSIVATNLATPVEGEKLRVASEGNGEGGANE